LFLSNGTAIPSAASGLADLNPMSWPGGTYYQRTGLTLLDRFAAYGDLYRRQVWVHVVIRKLALGTARLPFEVRARATDGTTAVDSDNPLAQLLDRPNEQLDGFRLWLWTSATKEVYGEAFWLKLRDDRGRVREIQPMHPANVIVERDELGALVYYYAAGVRDMSTLPEIPAADVVPFAEYDPETLARGMSSLEPLRDTLYSEDAARRATASWWKRGARPSIALVHPGTLSKPAQERLRATWDRNHTGADLMGGTAILEEGMKPEVIQLSAEEMQYVESRKLNREEVCAAYDMPPPVVHILDHATYSNISEQMRSLYRDTQAPRLNGYESAVQHHLVPDFDRSGTTFVRFNLDEVLRGDFETRAKTTRELINCGVMKPAEARPLFGLNPAGEEANQLYANAALVPLGSTGKPVGRQPPPEQPTLPAGTAGRGLEVRAITGRLGRLKSKRDELRERLVDEHRGALTDYFDRQHAAALAAVEAEQTKAAGEPEADRWTEELVLLLLALGTATARMMGGAVALQLGGRDYDAASLAEWIAAGVAVAAPGINATTAEGLAAALSGRPDRAAAITAYFQDQGARIEQISRSRVTVVGGMAEHDAATRNGARRKTWVTGIHPRVAHEALDGETRPVDEPFSNGMQRPGDPIGGPDNLANCNCHLTFSTAEGAP
jgi:HK97 family phage portal protein